MGCWEVLVSICWLASSKRSYSVAFELGVKKLAVDVQDPGSFRAVTAATSQCPTNQNFLQARHGGG